MTQFVDDQNQDRLQNAMTLVAKALRDAELHNAREAMAVLVLSQCIVVDQVRLEVAAENNGRMPGRGLTINQAAELLRKKLQQHMRRP